MSTGPRVCENCRSDFFIEPDDLGFYERMHAPAPKLCPDCRFARRALFRNEMSLYSRACDLCKKKIISMFDPESPYKAYCQPCYDSDQWDPLAYGKAYDPARPFFEQLGELFRAVPKIALAITSGSGPNVNSEYTNMASSNKNCYLLFNTSLCEDTYYSRGLKSCRLSPDLYFGVNMENCYEGVNVNDSSGVIHGQNVSGCIDCVFALNLSGCQNCFGCVNLRNKSYHWFNEPLTKEEYKERLAKVLGSYEAMEAARKKFEEFILQFPMRGNNNIKTVNSVGDYLFESKNLHYCFEMTSGENCKFAFSSKLIKDSYDILGYGYNSELLLDCCATGLSSRVIGSYFAELCNDVEYSFFIRSSNDCLGCDGLKNGKYCILNRAYSEAEYRQTREQIVEELTKLGEYGLFLPPALAPFKYNETLAQDNFPLTKQKAEEYGYGWNDHIKVTTGKETLRPEDVPDNIESVDDSVTKEILRCVACSRNYLITPDELRLYRKMRLPLPRRCFYCRHQDRIRRRGPMKIFDRTCAHCAKAIKTTYAPGRPEIIYCEACYQSEVI